LQTIFEPLEKFTQSAHERRTELEDLILMRRGQGALGPAAYTCAHRKQRAAEVRLAPSATPCALGR